MFVLSSVIDTQKSYPAMSTKWSEIVSHAFLLHNIRSADDLSFLTGVRRLLRRLTSAPLPLLVSLSSAAVIHPLSHRLDSFPRPLPPPMVAHLLLSFQCPTPTPSHSHLDHSRRLPSHRPPTQVVDVALFSSFFSFLYFFFSFLNVG